MLIKDEKCFLTDLKCDKVSTCRYFIDRFGVKECSKFKKESVEEIYNQELKERSELKTWSDKKEYLDKGDK